MADERPAPLVPADVNLRAYGFMPLHGETLRTSGFNARASDAEFRAAVNLWWSAWWQVPAGSLPNSDVELAALAGLRDMRRWRKVRAVVMEKWVLSSDDRWYHPFLSALAIAAWEKYRKAASKAAIAAGKRWKNNGHTHAAGIPTGIAPSINACAPSTTPSINSDAPSNANRSECNTPQPPYGKSTSKPTHVSHSVARAQAALADAQQAKERATPPPGGITPSDFLKQSIKPAASPSFEDLEA